MHLPNWLEHSLHLEGYHHVVQFLVIVDSSGELAHLGSALDMGISMSNDPAKLVTINKQSNHNIVQPHGLGKADGLAG